MLTGANQHIANYPGVTVDKKYGTYRFADFKTEVVDLPGTYSLTSFSLEERVTRNFLIREIPDVIVNVVDASALKRSLCFTFQIMEIGLPVVVALNMMDVASRNGISIDVMSLAGRLGVDIIPTVGRKAKGKKELRQAIANTAEEDLDLREKRKLHISYGILEPAILELENSLAATSLAKNYPLRWLAVKLIEGDSEAQRIVTQRLGAASTELEHALQIRREFRQEHGQSSSDYIIGCRDRLAGKIVTECTTTEQKQASSVSERIDMVLLNRFLAPFFLVATVFLIYQLSIVKGYELTQYWWPFLAKFKAIVASLLPDPGLLIDPYVRSIGLWMVDSANALLNYIPIFLILFALIAILEDSGYMARIAFILDRLFHSFGLHGQSTLPFILGGVFAGGCAVPGVMATKGIPDERARMATILTVPYMNCLAKIPFYTLLVSVFFEAHKSWVMLFLSTITIFVALLVAKFLTATILQTKETAPFVMALPGYHLPTFFGVGQRAVERTWQYIKKVGTIVVAVSVCVFTLLQFPGISDERMEHYQGELDKAVQAFQQKTDKSSYAVQFQDQASLVQLINLYNRYKTANMNAKGKDARRAIDRRYEKQYPDLFVFLVPGKDKDAKIINRSLRGLVRSQKIVKKRMKDEQIANSFLGMVGRGLEPVSQWAGFDWKINVAILSSFAARESSVATIGVLYQQGAEENKSLEERMGAEIAEEGGLTPLHALAVMVFFALYPPCLATTIMIKTQTGSYQWMLFSIFFPTAVGFVAATSIYTGGSLMGFDGFQMMVVFYSLVVLLTLAVGVKQLLAEKRQMPNPLAVTVGEAKEQV